MFNPDRFIENGRIVAPDHPNKQLLNLLIFGGGRRQCPGEQFVKNRIFLLVTMMLQRFKFLPSEGEPKPQTDPHDYMTGNLSWIKPYKTQVVPRN